MSACATPSLRGFARRGSNEGNRRDRSGARKTGRWRRTHFARNSPGSSWPRTCTTEKDFARLYPKLRDQHLAGQIFRDPINEEEATLARRYGGGRLL